MTAATNAQTIERFYSAFAKLDAPAMEACYAPDAVFDDEAFSLRGRREVGDGFGIPIVLRYVLETCETVADARRALERIPIHAAQNVTLLDRSGAVLTAFVGPGRPPVFVSRPATTNHQDERDWPE